MLGLTFSSKVDWRSYIISIAKTASKKIGAITRSMKFFFLRLLCISINMWACMEYCCHFWAGAQYYYFEFLDKLKVLFLLTPLDHRRNIASLSLFDKYYFGKCLSELAQLVPLPYSRGRSTLYSDRLHDFSVNIPRCYKDVYIYSVFPRTAKLWNSLLIECFTLTYCLNGFNSRISRHFLTVGCF